ncbi:MAG: L-lactate permease [Verrucomicrobiota bacterium]|jgi:lactate permease
MQQPWLQNYDPLHDGFWSTLVAALPIVVLLGSIALLRMRIHRAALLGLGVALAIALWVYQMPVTAAGATTVYGAAFGLFPIGWLVLNIIFLYQLTVKRGLFRVLRDSLATVAPDRRVQVLLIAFSFGAFLEGIAGFGTPVAITSAILIQLGFRPLHASALALIANTAPVAFGSLGIPITTLEQVTGLDVLKISAMVGRQLPLFSVLVPFWVVGAFAGWRGMLGVWPAALTAGLAFAVPQFLLANFHGPWLVAPVSGACSIAALVGLLRLWRPRDRGAGAWAAAGSAGPGLASATGPAAVPSAQERAGAPGSTPAQTVGAAGTEGTKGPEARTVAVAAPGEVEAPAAAAGGSVAWSGGEVFRAWLPWLILTGFILLWGLPQFKGALDKLASTTVDVPHLHQAVQRVPPVAPAGAKPEAAQFRLNLLSATGTGILLAAIVAGLAMGLGPWELGKTYLEAVWRIRFSLLTIAAMLALGNVTKYSGADATLGLALARTGVLYPFFGTLLGWLGVALTGSDTASNVLFGSLQRITAEQAHLSPILMVAANSSGGVMGKMVDAQSIVVASTATNWYGHEGSILRYVFFHSLALAVLMGLLVLLQAYVAPFTHLVPP